MFAAKLLCRFEGVNPYILSKHEILVLEAILFARICEELKDIFKTHYQDYFRLMKYNAEMENAVMEKNYIRCLVNDILSTEDYSLPGIAYYTYKPEDVILEVAMGKNTDPSSSLVRKLIELHQSVRPNLYRDIIKKIITA